MEENSFQGIFLRFVDLPSRLNSELCGGRKYLFSLFSLKRFIFCRRQKMKLSFFCFLSISDIFLWILRLDSGFQPLFLRRKPVFSQIDLEKLSFSGFLPEKDSSPAERQESIIFSAQISKKGYFRQGKRDLCEARHGTQGAGEEAQDTERTGRKYRRGRRSAGRRARKERAHGQGTNGANWVQSARREARAKGRCTEGMRWVWNARRRARKESA